MPNKTCIEDDFKYPLYSSVFSLVFILGLLLNMIALYIFTRTLRRWNETTIYMMNLVVSDTLFVLSLPFRIYYFINQKWPFGPTLCKISVTLFHTNLYGSILFLTCICLDRFLAIVYPFTSRSLRTKRKAKLACCGIWITLLSGSFTVVFKMNVSSDGNNSSCFEKYSNEQWKSELSKVVVFMETVGFVIPLLINLFCSVMIIKVLRHPTDSNHEAQLKKTKILRMIVVHLIVFCFCFAPYNINLVFYTLVRSQTITNCTVEKVTKTLYPISFCITVTNCCFDPVVYYFTSETIKSSIRRKSNSVRSGLKQWEVPGSSVYRSLRTKFLSVESTL